MQFTTKDDIINLIKSDLSDNKKVELLAHFSVHMIAERTLLEQSLNEIEQKMLQLADQLKVKL